MSFEEYEDDFTPLPEDDFTTSSESDADVNNITPATDVITDNSGEKIRKIKLSKKFVIISIIAFMVITFVFSFLYLDAFAKYRQNFIINIKTIESRLGLSEKISAIFNSDDAGFLKKREENIAMGTTYDNEAYMIPFENASSAKYALVDDGIIVAKSNYIACLNEKGETVWETNTSVVNPILSVDGRYISVVENGGTKICLYENSRLIYESDAQNEILNAGVSSQGDVVVVTKKEFFKGAVEVFNKIGERVFSWGSGTDSVMCADISPSGRKIAVGFLDSREDVIGKVQLFDIDGTESYKTVEIPDTVVFDIEFTGETLNIFGDNRFIGISVHGKVIWDELFDGDLSAYSIDKSGNKVAVIDSHNLPVIKRYSKRGDEKIALTPDELPDYIDIKGKYLLYNNTRMIIFGKNTRAKKYAATMDIKGLKIIDKDTYLVIYSNSLEFVHV